MAIFCLSCVRDRKLRRLLLGVVLLLLVDVIWVASSEVTNYLYKKYDKPFLTTYMKTSMFTLYLLGFLFWRPWQAQCQIDTRPPHNNRTINSSSSFRHLDSDTEESLIEAPLSEPIFVPAKLGDAKHSSGESTPLEGRVRFSNIMEIRHLSDIVAEDANLARMSFNSSQRAREEAARINAKLPIKQVITIAILFCLIWFLGNLSYAEAFTHSEPAVINILSSMSGLFTLILASLFPSNPGDKFTLSKLLATFISIAGIVLVSISDGDVGDPLHVGALWALCGALFYAVYLVLLRRKVDSEDKMDIPMFFGFVGLFNLLLCWPVGFILHYTNIETFELPNREEIMYIVLNGLIGTVLSEFLWLWACFLTSSLIATLSLSLTIPLTMLYDIFLNKVEFPWLFFIGVCPAFLSFFAVTLLQHYNNWDPVAVWIKRCYNSCWRKRAMNRHPEDREQIESLLGSS